MGGPAATIQLTIGGAAIPVAAMRVKMSCQQTHRSVCLDSAPPNQPGNLKRISFCILLNIFANSYADFH